MRNRRYDGLQGGEDVSGKNRLHDLEIDYARRLVRVREKEIKLTQTEYNIVALLSQHAGRVLTYASIIQAVWGSSDAGSIKKLQVNMANIRKKLGSRPRKKNYIVNELSGAVLSFLVFIQDYPPIRAIGISLFHSVAAFNNSGFDILGNFQNLIPYRNNVLLKS